MHHTVKNNLKSPLALLWASMLIGIIFSIFAPILILVNIYFIARSASSFAETILQFDPNSTTAELQKYEDINQELKSNSEVIKLSIIFSPNLSYIPVLGQEIFSWKLKIFSLKVITIVM